MLLDRNYDMVAKKYILLILFVFIYFVNTISLFFVNEKRKENNG